MMNKIKLKKTEVLKTFQMFNFELNNFRQLKVINFTKFEKISMNLNNNINYVITNQNVYNFKIFLKINYF